MSSKSLTLLPNSNQDHATRASDLMAEAKREAEIHIQETVSMVREAAKMLAAIQAGGDLYHAGIREEARQLTERLRVGLDRLATVGAR